MKQKNLELFNLAQRYKTRRRMRYGGKAIYNCRTIAEEAKHSLNFDISPVALSRFLFREKSYIRKGLRKGQYLKGKYLGKRIYEQTNRIFGNIEGEIGFNNLCQKIKELILSGKDLKKELRDLIWIYHLYPYKEGKGIIEDCWNWIAKDLERYSKEEKFALKKLEEIPIKKQKAKAEKEALAREQLLARERAREEYKKRYG